MLYTSRSRLYYPVNNLIICGRLNITSINVNTPIDRTTIGWGTTGLSPSLTPIATDNVNKTIITTQSHGLPNNHDIPIPPILIL